MATAPKPSFNFHARIDYETEERRRRLQERTGLSAPQLVREAFQELERHLDLPSESGTTTSALGDQGGRLTNCDHQPAAEPTEASRNGNFGSELMVKEDGSDREARNPLSFAPKHPLGRDRRSTSTEQLLLLTCCGRFPGPCPLTRSSSGDIYCPRCGGIAPDSSSAR